jgi:dGTP triphosphohydrolase
MSRVVNTDSVGKARNQQMRTAAEIIRRLSQKAELDAEVKDMAASLVYCFREIEDGIEEAMVAWEKRNYWNKVEQFRSQWTWVGRASAQLEQVIRSDAWDQLPAQLAGLFAHFSDITINKFTRNSDAWEGCYDKLLRETKPTR